MPIGVYIRTEETIKNNSEAQKGKHLSEETRGKMSIAHKDGHLSEKAKRKISKAHIGISPWNKGRKDPRQALEAGIKLIGNNLTVGKRKKVMDFV